MRPGRRSEINIGGLKGSKDKTRIRVGLLLGVNPHKSSDRFLNNYKAEFAQKTTILFNKLAPNFYSKGGLSSPSKPHAPPPLNETLVEELCSIRAHHTTDRVECTGCCTLDACSDVVPLSLLLHVAEHEAVASLDESLDSSCSTSESLYGGRPSTASQRHTAHDISYFTLGFKFQPTNFYRHTT